MAKTPFIVVRPGSGIVAHAEIASKKPARVDVYKAGVDANQYVQATGSDFDFVLGNLGEAVAIPRALELQFGDPDSAPAVDAACQLIGDADTGEDPNWYYDDTVFGVRTVSLTDGVPMHIIYSLSASGPVGKTFIVTPYRAKAGSPHP